MPKNSFRGGSMRPCLWALLTSGCLLASGCASIVNGTSQIVSVEAHRDNVSIEGAKCDLENSKGVYHVATPGTVTIHRAYDDLTVRCEKAPEHAGETTVKSSTKGMVFGNALFGGVIGVAVDTTSGAAYDYPEQIIVAMGPGPGAAVSQTAAPAALPVLPVLPASPGAPTAPAAPAAVAAAPPAGPAAGKPVAMDDLRYLIAPR
ncbi:MULTISPECIES: hypothetical protein [Cupriavidus]